MSTQVVVDGVWPGPLRITRGWARGEARPWNDEESAGHLRLVRGGLDFLSQATLAVASVSGGIVYSPALYPERTNIWRTVGYSTEDTLMMMERPINLPNAAPSQRVQPDPNPEWDNLAEVDRCAFSGFWRLGRHGLEEAVKATPTSVVLTHEEDGVISGYAIFGSQRWSSFLQRIAVRPEMEGLGIGTALIRAGIDWSRSQGAHSVLLNVRPTSERALNLYRNEGFQDVGTRLAILRWNESGRE